MKVYEYSCDGGSIKLGNEQVNIHLPNGYGDGSFDIYIGSEDEIDIPKEATFIGSIEGKFYVYGYDCSNSQILCELEGTYAISRYEGTIYLERWE